MVKTFYEQPHLMARFEGQLGEAHFTDPDALRVFRALRAHKKVISGLPFVSKPLNKDELGIAIEELQTHYFSVRTAEYAHQLIYAADHFDVKRIDDLMSAPPAMNGREESRSSGEAFSDLVDIIAKGGVNGIKPTSRELLPLDLVFASNTITVAGGISGHGKSAFGEQLLLDLTAQGANALDISLELTSEYRTMRYLQHLGGPDVGPKAFMEDRQDNNKVLLVGDEFRYIANSATTGPVSRKLSISGSLLEVPEILTEIARFAEDHKIYVEARTAAGLPHPGPPIVFIDFLQKVETPGMTDDLKAVKEAAKKLFNATKKYGLAMIWASQLNKAGQHSLMHNEEYLPELKDFESSGAIGQFAHTALFVWQAPNVTNVGSNRKVFIHFAKHRAGGTKTIEGLYHGPTMNFTFDPLSVRAGR